MSQQVQIPTSDLSPGRMRGEWSGVERAVDEISDHFLEEGSGELSLKPGLALSSLTTLRDSLEEMKDRMKKDKEVARILNSMGMSSTVSTMLNLVQARLQQSVQEPIGATN